MYRLYGLEEFVLLIRSIDDQDSSICFVTNLLYCSCKKTNLNAMNKNWFGIINKLSLFPLKNVIYNINNKLNKT